MGKAVLGIMAEVTCCSSDVLNIDHLMEKIFFYPDRSQKFKGRRAHGLQQISSFHAFLAMLLEGFYSDLTEASHDGNLTQDFIWQHVENRIRSTVSKLQITIVPSTNCCLLKVSSVLVSLQSFLSFVFLVLQQ